MPQIFKGTNVTEIAQILRDYIKVGTISSIDPTKHTARVVFPEDDNATSYDLPVICRNTYENHDYAMPDINEDVLCIFLPNGHEDGFILGSFYAGEVTPPTNTENERMVEFQDGTIVRYNRETHTLDVIIENTTIKADRKTIDTHGAETQNHSSTKGATRHDDTSIADTTKDYSLKADQTISDEAGTTISIKGGTTITIEAGTSVTIKAPSVTIDSPITTMTGNVVINGNLSQGAGGGGTRAAAHAEFAGTIHSADTITSDADVVASGVSLTGHTHTEQGDGASTSPPN